MRCTEYLVGLTNESSGYCSFILFPKNHRVRHQFFNKIKSFDLFHPKMGVNRALSIISQFINSLLNQRPFNFKFLAFMHERINKNLNLFFWLSTYLGFCFYFIVFCLYINQFISMQRSVIKHNKAKFVYSCTNTDFSEGGTGGWNG